MLSLQQDYAHWLRISGSSRPKPLILDNGNALPMSFFLF